MFNRPTKPTTPEQSSVIVWSFIGVCATLGAIGMWFSWRAPAEKAEVAAQLFWCSVACWILAALIYGGKRAIDYLLD